MYYFQFKAVANVSGLMDGFKYVPLCSLSLTLVTNFIHKEAALKWYSILEFPLLNSEQEQWTMCVAHTHLIIQIATVFRHRISSGENFNGNQINHTLNKCLKITVFWDEEKRKILCIFSMFQFHSSVLYIKCCFKLSYIALSSFMAGLAVCVRGWADQLYFSWRRWNAWTNFTCFSDFRFRFQFSFHCAMSAIDSSTQIKGYYYIESVRYGSFMIHMQ